MSIRFNCPQCQKTLKVPVQHAGRRARCPGCKNAVRIPTLDPVVSAEVEELAAATLGDEPPAQKVEEKTVGVIKFQCHFCDEPVEVSADLAGQQTPCPECRRIIKVPLPAKKEPLDWRKVTPRGPAAGLRRDEPAAPDGAWGSTNTSAVSAQAIIEAEALDKPPLTAKQWAVRGLALAGALAVIAGGVWSFMHWRGQNLQSWSLQRALEAVSAKETSLNNIHAAEIHRGIGEYLTRDGQAAEARQHFLKAQARLNAEATPGKSSAEVETAALDLALTQADLFGTQEEVQAGTRLAWPDAAKELRATLRAITSPEARVEAVRHLARKLVHKAPVETATSIAETLALHLASETDRPDLLAVVGVELIRAGHTAAADAVATKAVGFYDRAVEPRPPISPALVGLLVALQQEKAAQTVLGVVQPTTDTANLSAESRRGFALGWACLENWARAHQLANAPGSPAERWDALVAVADMGLIKNPEEGRKAVDAAIDLLETELRGRLPDGWSLIRFTQIAATAGKADRIASVIATIPDPALRARAQIELERSQLAAGNPPSADALTPAKDDPKPLLLGLRARHLARNADAGDVLKTVASWEPESLRPLGYIAVALGVQDRGQ
jgi:hypothetical protein